jgi:hypothetical protein
MTLSHEVVGLGVGLGVGGAFGLSVGLEVGLVVVGRAFGLGVGLEVGLLVGSSFELGVGLGMGRFVGLGSSGSQAESSRNETAPDPGKQTTSSLTLVAPCKLCVLLTIQ